MGRTETWDSAVVLCGACLFSFCTEVSTVHGAVLCPPISLCCELRNEHDTWLKCWPDHETQSWVCCGGGERQLAIASGVQKVQ